MSLPIPAINVRFFALDDENAIAVVPTKHSEFFLSILCGMTKYDNFASRSDNGITMITEKDLLEIVAYVAQHSDCTYDDFVNVFSNCPEWNDNDMRNVFTFVKRHLYGFAFFPMHENGTPNFLVQEYVKNMIRCNERPTLVIITLARSSGMMLPPARQYYNTLCKDMGYPTFGPQ